MGVRGAAGAYPAVLDSQKVGSYDARACAGGGLVWDEVLEYRVWMHLRDGAEDAEEGNDYFYAFDSYAAALEWSADQEGAQAPLALILQREFIDEPRPGCYSHVKKERVAEWPVSFLSRPRRTESTIPDFLSPDAPANRLEILRGSEA
ncbi:MAG: GCN5 family acetyltransferase [Acidobacteriota bacterium]